MYNPFSLEGKTILVTGASSGIGRACAIECSKQGAKCIISARNEERLLETKSSMVGDNHQIILADLTDDNALDTLVTSIDKVDGVVLNAGINDKSLIKFIKGDFVYKMLETNFVVQVKLIQALLKKKKIQNGASIVFMSSISAYFPTISNAMYGATKAALNQFAKVLALEVKPQCIRVNCIEPAFVETGILDKYEQQLGLDAVRTNFFNGRFAQPEEIAWSVIYLLSDATKMITGTTLVIDGGYTLGK